MGMYSNIYETGFALIYERTHMTLYRMWLIRLRLSVMPGQFFGAEEWAMLRAAHALPRNGAPRSSQDHGVGALAEAATEKHFGRTPTRVYMFKIYDTST